MVQKIAGWLPAYQLYVVGDVAYVGQHVLKGRPANVQVVGPLRWDAALSVPLGPSSSKQRKKGDRLRTPREMLDGEDPRWPQESICLVMPQGEKTLQVKVVRKVCWYSAAGAEELMVVLIHDPEGKWRDEALLSTVPRMRPPSRQEK
jgi:hypothetical protein